MHTLMATHTSQPIHIDGHTYTHAQINGYTYAHMHISMKNAHMGEQIRAHALERPGQKALPLTLTLTQPRTLTLILKPYPIPNHNPC